MLSSPQKQEDMYLTVHQVMVEEEVGVNRSPLAYDANPETERQAYHKSTGSTDRQMTLLKINGVQSGRLYASINWFPLHPISMNNKNAFVSGDNKGFASYLWELSENRDDVDEYDEIPIDESNSGYMKSSRFVAAFCQSNSGDVSPNIMGPRCSDTGEPCDGGRATSCDGDITKCMARGPGYTDGGDRQSTKIIGRRQYDAARRAAASRAVLNLTS